MRISGWLEKEENHRYIFLLALLACIFLLLSRYYFTHSVMGGDAVYYYSNVRSLVLDRDLDFENEFTRFHEEISPFTGNRKFRSIPGENPATGRLPNKYPIGSAILSVPFFGFGHIVSVGLEKTGLSIRADGYSVLYQLSTAFGSLFYGFIGMIVIYRLGRRLYGADISLLGAMAMWWATPVVYYMTMEPLMSHAISMAGTALFLAYWYSTIGNRRPHQWVALGLIGGLIGIVRYQDALFLIIPTLEIVITSLTRPDRSRKSMSDALIGVGAYSIAAVSVISLQLYANDILFGSPFATDYVREGFPHWKSPGLLYTLFSTQCGLLSWSPVLVFSFPGLYLFSRRQSMAGSLLVFAFILQWYLISSWATLPQGDSFGNRMLMNCTVIFAVGLMHFLHTVLHGKRRVFSALTLSSLGVFIVLNGVLMGLYCFRIIGNPY